VLELRPLAFGVVTCVADPAACDALPSVAEALALRLAPDEVMVLGAPASIDAMLEIVSGAAANVDPDAVVIDATDGWAAWAVRGNPVVAALSRLSAMAVPREGFVQGDVAGVPVKLVAAAGGFDLLVPAMWREYLRDAIVQRCRTLGIAETGR
jgi:hypothetical protein